eukprot:6193004-Pleurochrysis_carterae.AAC.5
MPNQSAAGNPIPAALPQLRTKSARDRTGSPAWAPFHSTAGSNNSPLTPTTNVRRWHSCADLRIAAHPRALLSTRAARHSAQHTQGLPNGERHIGFVVDSRYTYQIHPHIGNLITIRPCADTVSGVDGNLRPCVAGGDIPVQARDEHGRLHHFTRTGVRCVPSMRDPLLTVGQLWATTNTDCRFAGVRTRLPFIRRGGLFEWRVTRLGLSMPHRALAIHSSRAESHIQVMPADAAARCMHRRLHCGGGSLKRRTEFTSDASRSLQRAAPPTCEACAEANSTRLPHNSAQQRALLPFISRSTHPFGYCRPFSGITRWGASLRPILVSKPCTSSSTSTKLLSTYASSSPAFLLFLIPAVMCRRVSWAPYTAIMLANFFRSKSPNCSRATAYTPPPARPTSIS